MVTKMLVLAVAALVPIAAVDAKTYFQDGMKWEMCKSGTQSPDPIFVTETVSIDGEMDGMNARIMTCGYTDPSQPTVSFYVLTEGERVYCSPVSSGDLEWHLLYDFSLKAGEGCYVESPSVSSSDGIFFRTYVKCVSVKENDPEWQGWDTIRLEEYDSHDCGRLIGSGIWLKGLASVNGVLDNNRFDSDGVCSSLESASLKGETVYSRTPSSVTMSESDYESDIQPEYYSIDGVRLKDEPSSGIYLKRKTSGVVKIVR